MVFVTDAKLEVLAEKLLKELIQEEDFFITKTIIFPDKKSINWFKGNWLKNNNSVLMNIKLLTIEQALLELFDISSNVSLATKQQFMIIIIKVITEVYNEDILQDVIREYVVEDSTLNSIKLHSFAEIMTQLFMDYENDNFNIKLGWQKDLYDKVITNLKGKNLVTIYSLLHNNTLFKKQKIYVFGFSNFSKLQEEIFRNYDNVELYCLTKDRLDLTVIKKKLQLIAAPSKIRELEFVHSEICKSILNNKQLMYNDFLVISTKISEYEPFIKQVFSQDGCDYVSIPYAINTISNSYTDVYHVFDTLFAIYKKGFYTRKDFANIVTNKLIMKNRNIAKEDARAMLDSICHMRAYRKKDWDYLKKRLLLSKLIPVDGEFVIRLLDDDYMAFSNISLDDDVLVKFIKLIEDLDSLIQVFKMNQHLDSNNFELIEQEIDKWFVSCDEDNYLYLPIVSVFNNYKLLEFYDIDLDILLYTILSATKSYKVINQDVFINGVSFVDYSVNAIYSAKYIFFIGANSDRLPVMEVRSELDERLQASSINEQKENFYLQLFNATEKVYVSYQNLNLKTDETLYKTAFITNNIAKTIDDSRNKFLETVINIDENRDWAELFTKREVMNKLYMENLLVKESIKIKKEVEPTNEKPLKLDVYDIESFLKEPLKYKASKLFGYDDDLDDNLDDEYEPFDIDSLTRSNMTKKIITDLSKENIDLSNEEITEERKQKFIDFFRLNHLLPTITQSITIASFDSIYDTAKEIVLFAKKVAPQYKPVMIPDLLMKCNDDNWILTSKIEVLREEIENNLKYLEIKKLSKETKYNQNINELLRLYVISLLDVASRNSNLAYNITLYRSDVMMVNYQLTPQEAVVLLNKYYKLMSDYTNVISIPIECCFSSNIFDFNSYKKAVSLSWSFFKSKNMFDFNKDLGVDYNYFLDGNDFTTKIGDRLELISKIIKHTTNDKEMK